jgi:hypothetical protein
VALLDAFGKEPSDGMPRLVFRELSELRLKVGSVLALAIDKEDLPDVGKVANPLPPLREGVYTFCGDVANVLPVFSFWGNIPVRFRLFWP